MSELFDNDGPQEAPDRDGDAPRDCPGVGRHHFTERVSEDPVVLRCGACGNEYEFGSNPSRFAELSK